MKLTELLNVWKSDRLNDAFQVASDDSLWTKMVAALGGEHGSPVYSADGAFQGTIVSYGCTTYTRLKLEDKTASQDLKDTIAAFMSDSKVIYLHAQEVEIATLVHELFHYLCHRDFYTFFAAAGVGLEWKSLNEGITGYFTRKACPNTPRNAYPREYDNVNVLLKTQGFDEEKMAQAYFRGDISSLVAAASSGEL